MKELLLTNTGLLLAALVLVVVYAIRKPKAFVTHFKVVGQSLYVVLKEVGKLVLASLLSTGIIQLLKTVGDFFTNGVKKILRLVGIKK